MPSSPSHLSKMALLQYHYIHVSTRTSRALWHHSLVASPSQTWSSFNKTRRNEMLLTCFRCNFIRVSLDGRLFCFLPKLEILYCSGIQSREEADAVQLPDELLELLFHFCALCVSLFLHPGLPNAIWAWIALNSSSFNESFPGFPRSSRLPLIGCSIFFGGVGWGFIPMNWQNSALSPSHPSQVRKHLYFKSDPQSHTDTKMVPSVVKVTWKLEQYWHKDKTVQAHQRETEDLFDWQELEENKPCNHIAIRTMQIGVNKF